MKFTGHYFVFVFCLLFVSFFLVENLSAEEEEGEGIAEIVERSNMVPELQKTVIELFYHLHLLENSFRDEQWQEAALEVSKIDIFYNKILQFSEEQDAPVSLAHLQSFEFSLVEINRGVRLQDRKLVEMRFLELQPELFDILDIFATVPLRLTASRYYIDLALAALEQGRFDVALDELGEISEYLEQMAGTVNSRSLEITALEGQITEARKFLKGQAPESREALTGIRRSLETLYQEFSLN